MADNGISPEVKPFSADDIHVGRTGQAPPSYEEVIGQYDTSINVSQSEQSPSLAYIDIMPRLLSVGNMDGGIPPTFQNFSDIMTGANMWLAANPSLHVWKCETVERKVNNVRTQHGSTVSVDLQQMFHFESAYGSNCFVFGLRLWLCQKPNDQKGVQQLGLINALPTEKQIDVTMMHHAFPMHGRGFGMGMGFHTFGGSRMMTKNKFLTFEGLKKSLKDFNQRIQANPIPGSILNIESTYLKFCEGFKSEKLSDVCNAGSWYERKGMTGKRFTQILRIFYVHGPSTKPVIAMNEFLPSMTSAPATFSMQGPKFETFDHVINKARTWLQQQTGCRLVNIETRECKMVQTFGDVIIDTDRTDDFDIGFIDTRKIRFLRVFSIQDGGAPSMAASCLSSRLFIPLFLGGKNYEGMRETMFRVDGWLKAVGLPIVSVETCSYPRIPGQRVVDQQRCDFSDKSLTSNEYIATIRVYFPAMYDEPDPSVLPSLPGNKGQKSSSCTIV